eukprot:TRINITY_DN14281_c0_g1_i2.p1 TRINITY_DN14281_c0_g1~~TRINITY_DN14281_c0_g1_i2.p1  ORF type:complete len:642 (+),score=108.71 TRINITY_DN14281_c0_g1_i2:57-1982(+)
MAAGGSGRRCGGITVVEAGRCSAVEPRTHVPRLLARTMIGTRKCCGNRLWRSRYTVAVATAAAAFGAGAAQRQDIELLPLNGDGGAEDPSLLLLGHAPVAWAAPASAGSASASSSSAASSSSSAGGETESIFLDTALCFDRDVRLEAVDFFASDAGAIRAGRLRWHVLTAIPSHMASPTQWFRLSEAWPALPLAAAAAEAALPEPGAYRLALRSPVRLGFGDCVGWSVAGAGVEPFAYRNLTGTDSSVEVAWAESSEGLHDAVELYVKRGDRAANHIGWTGLLRRAYSVRLVYRPVAGSSQPAESSEAPGVAPPPQPRSTAPVVPGGNPACWRDGFTFERCCESDESPCWDAFFTYERCCTLEARARFANLDFVPKPEDPPHYELPHLLRDNAPRLGPVQDDEALLLYALVRATRPKTIVEFGTANGFSGVNWLHAIGDDPEALVFSYDILPYPAARNLEDADHRFVFVQKSQADFAASDVNQRPVDVAFFDAGHVVEYSLLAFERLLPSLTPTAIVAVHDTGLHVRDFGSGAPEDEEGLPFNAQRCGKRPGGAMRCRTFADCRGGASAEAAAAAGESGQHGFCVGRAHRPSERHFVRRLLQRWPEFRPIHVHSRRVFRHGLTLLQRGELWHPEEAPDGDF